MSLKLRQNEEGLDFAIRNGTKGPVIYPLNDVAMAGLKTVAPEDQAHEAYWWRDVGQVNRKQRALEASRRAFSEIVKQLKASNFKLIEPTRAKEKPRGEDPVQATS